MAPSMKTMDDREHHIKEAEKDFSPKVNPDVQHFIAKLKKDQDEIIERQKEQMEKIRVEVQYLHHRRTRA